MMVSESKMFRDDAVLRGADAPGDEPGRVSMESRYRYDQPELDPERRSGVLGSLFGPRTFRGGRVQVWGCSPGCLLLSLAVSVVLTLVLNLLLDFL